MDDNANRIKIVIADDHAIFRDGLRRLLEAEERFELIGEASDGSEAIELVNRLQPDVLLLDLAMPKLSGLEALAEVIQARPAVRVIILSAAVDRADIIKALQLGARGIVLKTAATQLLYKCIYAVVAGEMWVGRESVPDLIQALQELNSVSDSVPALSNLTHRERDVVDAVIRGASNKAIAQMLSMSEQTVKNHVSRILEKCGVTNRVELAMLAAGGRTAK
jgi:two-component system nitrate/nitrite response regulator NarL